MNILFNLGQNQSLHERDEQEFQQEQKLAAFSIALPWEDECALCLMIPDCLGFKFGDDNPVLVATIKQVLQRKTLFIIMYKHCFPR